MPESLPDVNVVPKQETVELLSSNGDTLQRGGNLADIFEKAESGVPIEQAIKEVSAPRKKEEEPAKEQAKEKIVEKQEASDLEKRLEEAQAKRDENVDVDRKKLLEETEQKKEEAPKKEEKAIEKRPEDEVAEEELQVLAHDKPKTAKRIQALLDKISKTNELAESSRRQADEKASKMKDLEDQLSKVKTTDPKVDEAIQKQLEELAMYRRRYDLDKDPTVKEKFDARIEASEKPVRDILARNGANADLLKTIEEEGGWLKFTQSNRTLPTADGAKSAAEVADMILQKIPFADRRALEAISTEQITTKREKERFFDEQIKGANEFFKKQEESKQKNAEEYQNQVNQAKKVIEDFQTEAKNKHKWLQEKEIPEGATTEVKGQIEEDNRYTRQLNQLMKKALSTKDIPGMLEVVMDSVQFYQERRDHAKTSATLKIRDKEVAELKDQITKFKNGGKTIPKAGSIAGSGNAGLAAPQKKEGPKSLDEAMDLIEAGQGSGSLE